MKNEVNKRKVDMWDKLLSCILDVAVYTKKYEDQLKCKTRVLSTQVAKCIQVDGGVFEPHCEL